MRHTKDKEGFNDKLKFIPAENILVPDEEKIQNPLSPDKYILAGNSFYKWKIGLGEEGNMYEKVDGARVLFDLKGNKKLFYEIKAYDFEIVDPDNTESYQQVLTSEYGSIKTTYFNTYQRLTHKPVPGKWVNTQRLLRHIFSEKNWQGEDMFDFALDFMQRLFYHPKEKLPILVLVSDARSTGKTAFLKWMNRIFQKNAITICSAELNSKSLYADKLLICCDDIDLAKEQRYIKGHLISNLRTKKKGKDVEINPEYQHLLITTHELDDFKRIIGDDPRFAIFRIPKLSVIDPNLLEECVQEIPHFLYYLKYRKCKYPQQSWFYFDPKIYQMQLPTDLLGTADSLFVKNFKAFMREYFTVNNLTECELAPVDIEKGMKNSCRIKFSKSDIIGYLRDEMRRKPAVLSKRYKVYYPIQAQRNSSKVGIPYYFTREEFMDGLELKNDETK